VDFAGRRPVAWSGAVGPGANARRRQAMGDSRLLRTLHVYVGRELARVTLLAVVALTLIMTVFAVIEPLRKRGLATEQVLALIAYTMPVMLSLTLPIAALFAATMVYGRFSQDNELLACRASGIATFALLRPALILGLAVTAVTLWLNNSVTPGLAEGADRAVKANIEGFFYQQLRTQGYLDRDRRIIHATRTYPKQGVLEGVVAVDARDPNNVHVIVVRQARILFRNDRGETFIAINKLKDVAVLRSGRPSSASEDDPPSPPKEIRVPSTLKEEPRWYSWGRLLSTLRHPAENRDIQRALESIRHDIAGEMLAKEVVAAVRERNIYRGLGGQTKTVVLTAGAARVVKGAAQLEAGPGEDGNRIPVRAVVTEPGSIQEIESDIAIVKANWWPVMDVFVVSVEFSGNTRTRVRGETPDANDGPGPAPGSEWVTRDAVKVGGLKMPKSVRRAIDDISLDDVLTDPRQFTQDSDILDRAAGLRSHDIKKLTGKILGEMHGRVAYGASCFLLVVLGASLGILFRGGQILSAFALSVIPAAIVVIMVLMGKQMLGNPGVPRISGLAAIWGGILLLVLANGYMHVFRLRK